MLLLYDFRFTTGWTFRCVRFAIRWYYKFVTAVFRLWYFFKKPKAVPPPTDPLLFLSATKASKLIRQRVLTSSELVQAYINRINEINDDINAISFKFFEHAIAEAEAVDQEIMQMSEEEVDEVLPTTKPLFGVPFTVKDSICIKGRGTTSGIYERRESISAHSAPAIERVLKAGGILLATTTVPEMCSWIETSSVLFGKTSNPYDLRRTSGGCSGGEGALLGAAGSLIGIASDYVAGIRLPAYFNCVFGFSPSPDLVSHEGHIPMISQVTYQAIMGRVGPLCRYAEDLPILLKVLSGKTLPPVVHDSVRVFFNRGLAHLVLIEPTQQSPIFSLEKAVSFYEGLCGVEAKELYLPLAKFAYEFMFVSYRQDICEPVMADIMNDSWSHMESDDQLNCLSELWKYICGSSKHSLPGILHGLTDGLDRFTEDERKMIVETRDAFRQSIIQTLTPNGILFYPSFVSKPSFHGEQLLKRPNIVHTTLPNFLGLPAVQCPMGLDKEGLPTGVMIIGYPGSDMWLLDVAAKISQNFGGWMAPGI